MNSRSLLFVKDMIFGKQKFDIKLLEDEQFMFNVKQLKMNKFIKYIWQLIISTSNATLEIPSLRPWVRWHWQISTKFFVNLLAWTNPIYIKLVSIKSKSDLSKVCIPWAFE